MKITSNFEAQEELEGRILDIQKAMERDSKTRQFFEESFSIIEYTTYRVILLWGGPSIDIDITVNAHHKITKITYQFPDRFDVPDGEISGHLFLLVSGVFGFLEKRHREASRLEELGSITLNKEQKSRDVDKGRG